MEETFTSRLKRVGYKIETNNLIPEEYIVKPANSKIVTGIFLIIIGVLLIPNLISPLKFVLPNIFDSQFGYDPHWIFILIFTVLGIFGFMCFYKGVNRLLNFLNFKLFINPKVITISKRSELKLLNLKINSPSKLSCDLNGELIVISCSDINGNRIELLSEKNSTTDCYPVLKQLVGIINGETKN